MKFTGSIYEFKIIDNNMVRKSITANEFDKRV